jgi:thiol-disulfide isomerase/thioredoxin
MSIVAYKFWSPTCAPCKVIAPALDELKEDFPDVSWVSVNTHEDPNSLALSMNVTLVPTMVVLRYDATGVQVSQESHTGTSMAGYYRILRNAQRLSPLK